MRERCRCGRRRGVVEFHLTWRRFFPGRGRASGSRWAGVDREGPRGLPLPWIVAIHVSSGRGGIFLVLWQMEPWQFALPEGLGRYDRLLCRRGPAVGPKKAVALAAPPILGAFLESPTSSWRLRWVRWAGASLCLRGAGPPRLILSTGDSTYRWPSRWSRSMAAAAGDRLENRPAGRRVMPLAGSTLRGRRARIAFPNPGSGTERLDGRSSPLPRPLWRKFSAVRSR
jgi:hypothetical protein